MSDLDVGHMPWLGPLSVSQTRLLGCDCFLSTVLLDDHGAPLDAKPGKRLVNAEQRVALIAGTRLRLPGCTCVPAWTDAHHIKHWANGGPTVMNNLVLLCRSHHRLMHRKAGFVGKWEIRIGVDNKPWSSRHPRSTPGSNRAQRTPHSKPENEPQAQQNTAEHRIEGIPRCGANRPWRTRQTACANLGGSRNRSRISAGVTTLGSRGCSSRRWRSNTLPVIGAMTFRSSGHALR